MTNTDIFDVLVVYTSHIAISASTTKANIHTPFQPGSKKSILNDVYCFFLKECKKNNLIAAFTTSKDIIGAGKAKSYWVFDNDTWEKVNRNCYAQQIFDKFSPSESIQKDILYSSNAIRPFSDKYLSDIFSDKLASFTTFSKYAIPTVAIDSNNTEDIEHALQELSALIDDHPNKTDFKRDLVLKDRYGSGGDLVFKIDQNQYHTIENILNKYPHYSFIIQPYVKFGKGFTYKDYLGCTEIRLILNGTKIIQSYIRVADNDKFLCNEGVGGIQLKLKDIPKSVITTGKKIASNLKKKNTFYALDFIVSDNKNVYLLEGNINPGIDWYPNFPENIRMNQNMIQAIIREILRRTQTDMELPSTLEQEYISTQIINSSPLSKVKESL